MNQTAITGPIANAMAYPAMTRCRASAPATSAAIASSMTTTATGIEANSSCHSPPLMPKS